MQPFEAQSSHRKGSKWSDSPRRNHDFASQHLPHAYPVPVQGPYFSGVPPSNYYLEPIHHQSQPYMLPYAPFQQSQSASPLQYHSMNIHDARSPVPNAAFQHHTPPLKRPRTELRHNSNSSPPGSLQRYSMNPAKNVNSKSAIPRKTFSDFRISRVRIGTWVSEESKEEHDARDSKIRFCFRNQNDREVPSTLSASEAALVMPDRVSISVLKGTQRIIIPAHHIKSVDFRRNSGEITVFTDGWAAFEMSRPDASISRSSNESPTSSHFPHVKWSLTEEDLTEGQLSISKKIEIQLDMQKPLTEPKWTRGHLDEYIDSSSRFLSILKILDAKPIPSIEGFFDQWAGDDNEKAYFYEYQLTPAKLLEMMTALMSTSNILTPAIITALKGMLHMLEVVKIPDLEVVDLLKSALYLIPSHMLAKSLDGIYHAYLTSQETALDRCSPRRVEMSFGGSKRQRGESEVPSDQLAKTTLDEKRRRLSDSEPQVMTPRRILDGQRGQLKTNPSDYTKSVEMTISKSEDSPSSAVLERQGQKARTKSEGSSSASDGPRLSREELLRSLEDQEGQDSSSDEAPQEAPLEAASLSER